MAAGDPIPDSFPEMGATFEKPYMEFEYQGELYRVENLRGGHNGRAAAACQASPPRWDEEKQRWVVPVENNIIDIDMSQQTRLNATFSADSPLSRMRILSNPRSRYSSSGFLISSTASPQERPTFPVTCEFNMFIRVSLPGRPSVINTTPFRLVAENIEQWPPPVGTRYKNLDDVDLYPEYVPLYSRIFSPIARIRAGDEAVLTEVFVR